MSATSLGLSNFLAPCALKKSQSLPRTPTVFPHKNNCNVTGACLFVKTNQNVGGSCVTMESLASRCLVFQRTLCSHGSTRCLVFQHTRSIADAPQIARSLVFCALQRVTEGRTLRDRYVFCTFSMSRHRT